MKLNGLLKAGVLLTTGFVVAVLSDMSNVSDGDVVYEDDNMYILAAKNRSMGYSTARVHYKKPIKKDGE